VIPGGLRSALFVLCAAVLLSALSRAQDTGSSAQTPVAAGGVAATVDGVEIYAAQVERYVRRMLGTRSVDAVIRRRAQAEALEHLIQQQMVLASLERRGEACSQQQLDLATARFKEELVRQEKSLEDYCQSMGIPVPAFERAMRWQLSWERYLQKSLTDENLRSFFESHRRDFDGTKMRVAQILFALPDDPAGQEEVRQRAETVREEIAAGKISFSDAARKYSQAPSGQTGGELPWISRHEPMPEIFSQAAYRLQLREISSPVVSPLGVHVIECLEIEPGTRTWSDVREPLTAAVREHLFAWHASRPDVKPEIHFTGATCYFRPVTRELVVPEMDRNVDAEPPAK
jgi:parvulin-like peptidyl-prolyl isomerase